MTFRTLRVFALVVLTVLAATSANAAGKGDTQPGGMDMSMMQPMTPSAQQQDLLKCVGTWKATGKMYMAPGQPPMTFEGIEEMKAIEGGMWVYVIHKSPAMKFEGHSIQGWDGGKQKYVGWWVDSWSVAPMLFEGTKNADGKSATFTMTGPNMQGQVETSTMIEEFADNDHRSWKSWKGTDTSGAPTMEMTYVRVPEKATKGSAAKKTSTP